MAKAGGETATTIGRRVLVGRLSSWGFLLGPLLWAPVGFWWGLFYGPIFCTWYIMGIERFQIQLGAIQSAHVVDCSQSEGFPMGPCYSGPFGGLTQIE